MQRALMQLSANMHETRVKLENSYGQTLTVDQRIKLNEARERALDAAEALHSIAAELVGELKK